MLHWQDVAFAVQPTSRKFPSWHSRGKIPLALLAPESLAKADQSEA